MTLSIVAQVWLTVILLSGVSALTWDPLALEDNAMVYACVGSNVTLNWTLSLTSLHETLVVAWQKVGASQKMIAMSYKGRMTVTPSYSERVQQTGKAGLVLLNASIADSGTYFVAAHAIYNGSIYGALNRTATITIGDKLMTVDGQLRVKQLSEPVYDVSTRDWRVALHCGTFVYKDPPPFFVQWRLPSGQSVPSVKYLNGQYDLLLDNPVSNGTYTCYVPASSKATACLRHNTDDVSASVYVDDVRSRLTLLEAKEKLLKANVKVLGGNVTALEAEKQALKENAMAGITVLEGNISDLETKTESVEKTLAKIRNKTEGCIRYNKANNNKVQATLTAIQDKLNNISDVVRCLNKAGIMLEHGGCVQLYREAKTWNQARSACQSTGGDLVVFNSTADLNAIKAFTREGTVWIGASKQSNGEYQWFDGTPIPRESSWWMEGEPNKGEWCINIYETRGINDDNCNMPWGYMCME